MSERVPVEPAEPRPEQVLERTRRYLGRHGWDLTDDEATWRAYQRRQMALEYQGDSWQEPATPVKGSGPVRKENHHGS
jgi:hypothetical protein